MPKIQAHKLWCRAAFWDARSCPIYFLTYVWSIYFNVLTRYKHSWDAQNSPPQIMVSNGLIGCPFMPDLLFKFHLSSIVWCFDTLEI